MKYFEIIHSLDKKVVGVYSQAEQAKYLGCINDPNFIDRVFFEKATFKPITAKAMLLKKAKLTDLISVFCIGFTAKLLVSGKFKKILNENRKTGIEFFNSPVIFQEKEIPDYWVLNIYKTSEEFIDFEKSTIKARVRKPEGGTEVIPININSYSEFREYKEIYKKDKVRLFVDTIVLNSQITEDFFTLRGIAGGFGYFVSEKLKIEMENKNLTGMEFVPL